MAQHNSTNAADINNEYFPVRIQIKSSHVNYQDQNQEVIKPRARQTSEGEHTYRYVDTYSSFRAQ